MFLKFFGACGGLVFFQNFSAPAAGFVFFKICRRLRRALFLSKFFGACGGLVLILKICRRLRRALFVQLFRRPRRALVSLSLNYLISCYYLHCPVWAPPPKRYQNVSAPAAGLLLFSKFFGACGGLCFFKNFRRLRRALFFQNLSAPAAGFVCSIDNCFGARGGLLFLFR